MTTGAAVLAERLGLGDEELLTIVDADPLTVMTGDLEHRPEIPILLALTEDIDESVLRRWLRTEGPSGRPLDLLLARDFPTFENAVEDLRNRGLVLRARKGVRPSIRSFWPRTRAATGSTVDDVAAEHGRAIAGSA